MRAPDQPPRDVSGVAAERQWAEYLERYDRLLALYERSVTQQESQSRQYDEQLRLQTESQEQQRRQFDYQRRTAKWVVVGVAALLGVAVAVAVALEAAKAARNGAGGGQPNQALQRTPAQ